MFVIIMNDGDYRELPYAKSREEAERMMLNLYSWEEIEEKEMEVVEY